MQSNRLTGFLPRHIHAIASLLAIALLVCLPASEVQAQRGRVNGPVDNSHRTVLQGHIAPRLLDATDQGPIDPAEVLPYVTLVLRRTAAQQADLEQLLANQQNPSSPDYHRWLTPEQFANRFGAAQADIDQIAAWAQQQNLNVAAVARSRSWVALSGPAGQFEKAFAAQIHRYQANGRMHYANATEPSIPAAFAPLIAEIHGLNDFRLHAPRHRTAPFQPAYNSSHGANIHYLAPDDVAVIYNVKPLLDAGIDGTGQKIAVVGQSNINISDSQQFRSYFGLAANDPQLVLVPGSRDPGIVSGDADESNLDIELAGAVARKATVLFVYSNDVVNSAAYVIDQALAPVLSMSYGACEAETSKSSAKYQQFLAQQAVAQGITWVNASGDSGAADCVGDTTSRTNYGLQVDLPAAVPEVTGIGGTTFNEGSGTYWASANSSSNASALSYIPETAWNDSAADGTAASTGGGASIYWTKPSWQSGPGVPADGARDVPDVSLSGSADHDGYMVYTGGKITIFGGTSTGAPTFAGMLALLNHYLVANGLQSQPGLGNINPTLYALAQTTPAVFHDVTTGDNIVNPCPARLRTCTATPVGFTAGPGYDQVTGLGSVDAYALVMAWHSGGGALLRANAALTLAASDHAFVSSGSTVLTATVKSFNGGTPSGTVEFFFGTTSLGSVALEGGTASLVINGSQLPLGSNSITVQYSGDTSYNPATSSITLTVAAPPTAAPSLAGFGNGASFRQVYAPGMILSIFGNQLAPATESAQSLPLPAKLAGVSATINGVTAPLYYVSPSQVNLQVPYETPVGGNVTLTINNNGQSSSTTLRLAAAAPGIFVDANGAPLPNTTAVRGSVVTLYITGDGAVSPALATGATPASGTPATSLPKPVQAVTVTVGGVNAPIQFIGIPSGLAGVTQINYQVPSNVAAGAQTVVVTVGGVASPAATLAVQ
jgi:uncharacterized protein (TIGR03437 family)